MMQRRDIVLGIALIVGVGLLGVVALMVLAAVTFDEPLITEPSIAVVDIVGGIYSSDDTVDLLDRYMRHDKVAAIVIRLDTPGGGVAATQEIYETVLKARKAGKLVIASMGTVAASGGYYIASACDTIMANPATMTGSIGVIATFPNFSGLYEKIGVGYNVVKTGQFKDTGSTARKMTDEERAYLDGVVADTFDQFLEAVADGRRMSIDAVRPLADGRVFTGRQAQKLGLIDLLGTYQDALDLAGRLTGLGERPRIFKERRSSFWDIAFEGMSTVAVKVYEQRMPAVSYLMNF
jgi:protease IV